MANGLVYKEYIWPVGGEKFKTTWENFELLKKHNILKVWLRTKGIETIESFYDYHEGILYLRVHQHPSTDIKLMVWKYFQIHVGYIVSHRTWQTIAKKLNEKS
jgi:hypothetical protein